MLSDSEKGEALFYLGYPAETMVVGSINYSKRVMDRFVMLPDHLETRLRKCMSRIRNIDELLDAAATRFVVVKISDTELNPKEREQLLLERKRFILQLSSLTDVPCMKAFNANIRVSL